LAIAPPTDSGLRRNDAKRRAGVSFQPVAPSDPPEQTLEAFKKIGGIRVICEPTIEWSQIMISNPYHLCHLW
tara:strand:+ start:1476 stop:1691 length:216 start_codon:yes stop_codon:yes gene_type:complete